MLAVSAIGVILLYEYLWLIWIVCCATLALVIAEPTISSLLSKRSKRNRHDSAASPQISTSPSVPGSHPVHVDATVSGGGENLSLRSTGAADRHVGTYSDQV